MGTQRALLIGINAYPNLERQFPGSRPLTGCLQDVQTMAGLLQKRGFDDIRQVIDGEGISPTRSRILGAMDALYDAVAQAANGSSSPDDADVVVFFFAGHGSQVHSRGVPGSPLQEHTFQTLVTSDSGRSLLRSQGQSLPNRDLFDFEIDAWVRRLRQLSPAPAITLIFDCCHSAGLSSDQRGRHRPVTESSGAEASETERAAPVDHRNWDDLNLDAAAREAWKELTPSSGRLTRGVSGWRGQTLQEAVVIAACRNEETSMGNAQGGFLTHALSKALERYPQASSWKDVFDPIVPDQLEALRASGAIHRHFSPIYSKVQGRNRRQHPVRHGNGPIFAPGTYDYENGYPDGTPTAPLKTFAVVIGISDYGGSWTDLQNARRDAEAMAETLEHQQGYEVLRTSSGAAALCDREATFLGIFRHLHRLRRAVRTYRRSAAGRHRGTASVIYFAGHGASVPDDDQRRVKGYLIPHGGRLDAPSTWLSMSLLRQFLTGPPSHDPRPKRRLRSRHLLLILDCCFAGAIRFASLRRRTSLARPIFASEYRRFVEGEAWQVLTSSSYHQSALDVVRDPRNPRSPGSRHSPFAQALIEALSTGVADVSDGEGRRDRIVTAGELHQYLDHRLKVFDFQQPGLAPLSPGNRGQFFFRVPGWQTVATPDPPLDTSHNPWAGFHPYDARQRPSDVLPFHGRQTPLLQLLAALLQDAPGPRVLTGANGSGKTSLVLGGLWPLLQDLKAHRHTIRRWVDGRSRGQLLLSPTDLAGVRRWMQELQLPELFHDADALRQRIVTWGRQQGTLAPEDELSPTDMSGHLPASLFDLMATESHAQPPWWEAARLIDLMARPEDLLFHLRFWHQEPGLADLLLVEPDEESEAAGHWAHRLKPWHTVYLKAKDLMAEGSWQPRALENHLQDAPADVPRLLVLDDADDLLASPGFRQHGLQALAELERPNQEDTAALPWRVLWILGSHVQTDGKSAFHAGLPEVLVASLTQAAKTGDETPSRERTVHLLPPNRQELRDAIEQPLLDRALLMPARVVDDIVEAASGTPSPFALLGPCLHAMYQQAVQHREGDDRSLTFKHYSAVGSLTGPWKSHVRRHVESAGEDDRRAMFRLFRRFSWRPGSTLDVQIVLPPETSSPPSWFTQLLKSQAIVWDASGIRLGQEDLLDDWPAFTSWKKASPAFPWEDTLAELAPRALEWSLGHLPEDRRASRLWDDYAEVLDLLGLQEELNVAERSFLAASLERCRAHLAQRLAGEALRAPERRWNHSLLLAAQALELAQTDRLKRSVALAQESLRRLLAMSPLTLKVDLPGIARKLAWLDDRQLHVLTSNPPTRAQAMAANVEDPWQEDWAWRLDLDSDQLAPELVPVPSALDVKARPVRFQEAEMAMLEAADADQKRFARLVPFTQRLSLEQKGHEASQTLRGIAQGLRYLAWTPSGDWLAVVCQPEDAAAAAPSYGLKTSMENAVAELRLWRCTPGDLSSASALGAPEEAYLLDAVSEPRCITLTAPPRDISHLAFAAQGTALVGLERGQGPFSIDLEPPIPTRADPSRWLGAPKGRLHGWKGRTMPALSSSEGPKDSGAWLWAVQRSRRKRTVLLWDLQMLDLQAPGTSREIEVEGVREVHTISRGGRFLVDQRGREARLVNASSGAVLGTFRGVDWMEIAPDERWAAWVGGGQLRCLDLEHPRRKPLGLPLEARSPIEAMEIAPGGRWLALRSREGNPPDSTEPGFTDEGQGGANVWLWFAPNKPSSEHSLPEISPSPSLAVQGCRFAFSPSGRQWVVAHASAAQWFRLGEDRTCELQGQIALASYPTALEFHPTGDRVAVGGLDGSVLLWSRPEPGGDHHGMGVETLRRSDDNVQGQSVHVLTFDDDGDRLAVALAAPRSAHGQRHLAGMLRARPLGEPHTLLAIYDLSPQRLVQLARACAGRVLDEAAWQRHLAPEPYRPGDLDGANVLMQQRLGIRPATTKT